VFHQILEKFFEQEWDLASLIAQELRGSHLEGHETAVEALIQKVLDLRLNGFCLRDIDRAKALPEMEFLFSTQESFLKGFIDLCFEHEGKYYLIDWKTNLLEDYTPQTLEKAMEEHDYLLQGKIYTEAFSRYLKLYGRSLGGIYFVFVRGPAAYHFLPEALNV
jgi:exodeoxyribonuclease V beta subunit